MPENNSNIPDQQSAPEPPASAPELPQPTPAALELEDLQQQLSQAKDLLLRKAAEFENYKRRTENDISSIIKRANEEFVANILPVVDDLERSLKASRAAADADALLKGVELIYQKLVKTLEGLGVRPFETVGKEFSVDYHDALLQIPRADLPPHTVVEEIERGYTLYDRVIRHAKVIVSAPPSTDHPQSTPVSN